MLDTIKNNYELQAQMREKTPKSMAYTKSSTRL